MTKNRADVYLKILTLGVFSCLFISRAKDIKYIFYYEKSLQILRIKQKKEKTCN